MSSTTIRLLTTSALFGLLAMGAFKAGSMYMSGPDPVSVLIPKGATLTIRADHISDSLLGAVVEPAGAALISDSALGRKLQRGDCHVSVTTTFVENKFTSIGDSLLLCDKTDVVHIKAVLGATNHMTLGDQYQLHVEEDSAVDIMPPAAP